MKIHVYFWHHYSIQLAITSTIFILRIIHGNYNKLYHSVLLIHILLVVKRIIIQVLLLFDSKLEIVLLQHDTHILEYKNMIQLFCNYSEKYYNCIHSILNFNASYDLFALHLCFLKLLILQNCHNMIFIRIKHNYNCNLSFLAFSFFSNSNNTCNTTWCDLMSIVSKRSHQQQCIMDHFIVIACTICDTNGTIDLLILIGFVLQMMKINCFWLIHNANYDILLVWNEVTMQMRENIVFVQVSLQITVPYYFGAICIGNDLNFIVLMVICAQILNWHANFIHLPVCKFALQNKRRICIICLKFACKKKNLHCKQFAF